MCCYTTQEYISNWTGTLFSSGRVALKRWQMMWPTNSRIPWNFKYWLMCLWCTFLTERDITNTITFSAVCEVHGLPHPGRLSTQLLFLATPKTLLIPILTRNSFSFCAEIPLSRYRFLIKLRSSLLNGMFTNSSDIQNTSFSLPWKIGK